MLIPVSKRPRPPLRPWVCPLCERKVIKFSMWQTETGFIEASYIHADNERCFVVNQSFGSIVAHIREIDNPR